MASENGQDRGERFEAIAMSVRNRDAGRCIRCGDSEEEERLSVHHLIPDSKIPDEADAHLPVNLVTLCRSCHLELESEPAEYQLRKLQIENQTELMLSDDERQNLNDRLDGIGPDILNVKKISKEESQQFIEKDFDNSGSQTDISDFEY